MSIDANPLTLVYEELWKLLEAHPQYPALIRPRNRITFGDGAPRKPIKDQVQAADLPEIMLTTDGGLANMQSTSSTSMLVRRYTWVVTTGDQVVDERLYKIEWLIFVAMLRWHEALTALEWPVGSGQNFVRKASISDISEGKTLPDRSGNRRGWASLWRVQVDMHFRTSDLKAELNGDL